MWALEGLASPPPPPPPPRLSPPPPLDILRSKTHTHTKLAQKGVAAAAAAYYTWIDFFRAVVVEGKCGEEKRKSLPIAAGGTRRDEMGEGDVFRGGGSKLGLIADERERERGAGFAISEAKNKIYIENAYL